MMHRNATACPIQRSRAGIASTERTIKSEQQARSLIAHITIFWVEMRTHRWSDSAIRMHHNLDQLGRAGRLLARRPAGHRVRCRAQSHGVVCSLSSEQARPRLHKSDAQTNPVKLDEQGTSRRETHRFMLPIFRAYDPNVPPSLRTPSSRRSLRWRQESADANRRRAASRRHSLSSNGA